MARGLDHIVHAVHDLDAAAALYRRLGFMVGARNRHPWGTHNYVVQLPGFFIELLTVAEPEKIVAATPRSFSFGAFTQGFLARQQGFAMLVLESTDAREDSHAFRSHGIGDYDVFHFERRGSKPDGSVVKVAFSLAFATAPEADAGFFVCQQHYPENFWNASFQNHPNTAANVAGVVMVANTAGDYTKFLSAFTDAPIEERDGAIVAQTGRGTIETMSPASFANRFAVGLPDVSSGARIAALRLYVGDLGPLQAHLAAEGIKHVSHEGCVVIAPEQALGATIILESR